jgi:hypothetical protein
MVYMQDNKTGFIFTTHHPKFNPDCKKLTMKVGKAALKEQCIAKLKTLVKPGSTVSTSLINVSRTESQVIFTIDDPRDGVIMVINNYVSVILDKSQAINGTIIVKRCGMDMGFKLTNEISSILWPIVTSGHALKHKWI